MFNTVVGERLKLFSLDRETFYYGYSPCASPFTGTLILLHGVASNGSRWEEFTEASSLRRAWSVVRLDLRGHGGNESFIRADLERFSEDLVTLINDISSFSRRPVVLIGHSLGAQIALNCAVRYPTLINGLVLLDPLITEALTVEATSKEKWLPVLRAVEFLARCGNKIGLRRKLQKFNLRAEDVHARNMLRQGGDAVQQFIRSYSSPRKDLHHVHTAVFMRDLIEVSRDSPLAKEVLCPTLVIGSSAGVYTDAHQMSEWTRQLNDGEFKVVSCAHWPLTECPLDVSSIIEEWVERKFPSESRVKR